MIASDSTLTNAELMYSEFGEIFGIWRFNHQYQIGSGFDGIALNTNVVWCSVPQVASTANGHDDVTEDSVPIFYGSVGYVQLEDMIGLLFWYPTII